MVKIKKFTLFPPLGEAGDFPLAPGGKFDIMENRK